MSKEHFLGEVAQKAFITHNDSVLMVRNTGTDFWDFPEGRLHVGETPMEGLQRELREELSVSVAVGVPLTTFVLNFSEGTPNRFFILYACTLESLPSDIEPDASEISEFRWITRDDVSDLECPPIWKRILQTHFTA